MTLNIGPQHPATHGTLRIVVRLDGEQVVWAEPVVVVTRKAAKQKIATRMAVLHLKLFREGESTSGLILWVIQGIEGRLLGG